MRLRPKFFRGAAVVLATALAMALPVMAGTASAAPASNLLRSVDYYTTGPSFCRSSMPTSATVVTGAVSQSRNRAGDGPLGLSITGVASYATVGFYKDVGTLGGLAGYSVHAHGTFGDNLWLDTNTTNDSGMNGPFFTWTGTCLTATGGDSYGLGPSSTPTGGGQSVLTVNDTSTFFMASGCNHSGTTEYQVTLGQLKSGYCTGITGTTQAAVWLGITAVPGTSGTTGTLHTTITSAQLTP